MGPLLIALLLGQWSGGATQTQAGNWSAATAFGGVAAVSAPLSASGCYASGVNVGKNAPATVTRATGQTNFIGYGGASGSTFFQHTNDTVVHATFPRGALVDLQGNQWTQVGSPTPVTNEPGLPNGTSLLDGTNHWDLTDTTTLRSLPGYGGFLGCAVLRPDATDVAATAMLFSMLSPDGTQGWQMVANESGFVHYNSAQGNLKTDSPLVAGKLSVICWGDDPAVAYGYLRVNTRASVAPNGAGIPTYDATTVAKIGSHYNNLLGFHGTIYEVWIGNPSLYLYPGGSYGQAGFDTWSSAMYASFLARQNYLATCAANTLAISTNGAEVYAAGTNTALQSSSSCVANAIQAPWASDGGTATCASDTATAPDGTSTADAWTSVNSSQGIYQTLTTASSATFTASAWMMKPSATGPVTILNRCMGTTLSACSCGASGGASCVSTAGAPAATDCRGVFTVTTTPVRGWVSATCGTAITAPQVYFHPGEWGVSNDTTRLWGVQFETGIYPTPYIPTTAAAVTRNATTVDVPLPALHATNRWCIGATTKPTALWNVQPAGTALFSSYAGVVTNVIKLELPPGAFRGRVWDSAGTERRIEWVHGLGATTAPQRVVLCNSAGVLSMYVNGVSVGTLSLTGTALQSATMSPMRIGAQQVTGESFDGSITNLKVYQTGRYTRGM